MPGKSKPASEYKKKFRWHDSYRSSSFEPSADQRSPSAGIPSTKIGQVTKEILEPPLQQRRKPLDNTVKRTYTTSQFYHPTASSSEDGSIPPSKPTGKKHAKHHHKSSKPRSSPPDQGPANNHHPSFEPRLAVTKILNKNNQNSATSPSKDDRHKTYSKLANGHHSSGVTNGHASSGGTKSKDGHRSSNDSGKSSKKPHDVDAALQYQAGIRARPLGPRYLSEYQRQFDWKQVPKESPLIAADELIHKSNTNIAPFDPSKIPKKTEYNTQFKAYYPPAPSLQQQLKENVEQEMKARYKVKTKTKKNKKNHLSPEQMKTAGMPSVIVHEDPKLLKGSQNPQKPFFPHASVRKWKTEYHSNFKAPSLFRYEEGVWKGANPPHIQPQEDSSESGKINGKLKHSKSEGDIPSWFAEVLELRNRAQEYQKRSQGTHFSRERMAQLMTEAGAGRWDESSTGVSTSSLSTSISGTDPQEGRQQDSNKPSVSQVPENRKKAEENGKTKLSQGNKKGDSDVPRSSPVRRQLAWGEDEKKESTDNERRSSFGSIPTPDGYGASVSDNSDDLSVLSEEGRLPTPRLENSTGRQRHHLDKTTPAAGGAILTSPPKRKEETRPRTAPNRLGLAQTDRPNKLDTLRPKESQSERAKTIIPGGVSRAFEYDSDEDDDDDDDSMGEKDEEKQEKTQRPSTPPRNPRQIERVMQNLQTSPTAGKKSQDPDPLSPEPAIPFQRHSRNFFETSPAMPVMPNKIEPPKTWAQPRSSLHQVSSRPQGGGESKSDQIRNGKTYNLRDGPLNRPSSGSIHGRPLTAYPQTREHAAKVASRRIPTEERPNSFISGDTPRSERLESDYNGNHQPWTPSKPRENRDSDELSISNLSTNSSISLASEVLERARKRRDDFWGKKAR